MSLEFILICAAIVILLCSFIIRLYEKNTNALCKSEKRIDGKTVLVTGGTIGMGLEVARDFARRGGRVIIACPYMEEGVQARKTIIEQTGNQDVIFKLLDLASLASVREFADSILTTENRLDILINNAGVLAPRDRYTTDGMLYTMQVNYFGHFVLTILLLPLLKKTGTASEPSRIVNMSSVLHNFGTVNFENINRVGYYYRWRIYCNSKLCVAMFTRELSKRLKDANIVVNSVDPGAVGTTIYDTYGKFIGTCVTYLFGTLFKTPWEGCQTTLHVALDDKAGQTSGKFYKNCKLSKAIWTVYNDNLCERLWEESVRYVKLKECPI